uniref:helix-turn-helix domain-containing protein n=1 Tax=Salinigranum rubrum TaxID=755307 RepID=UPI001C1F4499|nr:helix-turn-helix domain-containing protein [Salinigranum rubrum]
MLDDGTFVGLYELHGDADEIRSGIRYLPGVLSYDVTGTDPVYLYLHEEATEPARTLLEELRSSRIVLDRPFEHQMDGTLRLTIIGEDDVLRETFDALADIVDVDLVETGEYQPDLGDIDTLLTDRQREILRLAVERGYYEVPRQVTHQELAEECDRCQSTIAEHLQKIEATVLPHVIQ